MAVRSLAIVAPLVLFGAGIPVSGATPAERELVVANQGKRAINELYVSPASSEDWGDDRLRNRLVAPGRVARVRIGDACDVDVQVVYDNASREERHHVDSCIERRIAFDGTRAILPDKPEAVAHRVVVANAASRPVQQLFISSADAGDWGDDLLRAGALSSADRVTVTYGGSCRADIRIVFDSRAAEERRDVDLCALGGLTIRPGWTTDALASPVGEGMTSGVPQSAPQTASRGAGRS